MKLYVTKQRSLWWTISAVLIVISIISMLVSWIQLGAPLRPSLDFVGGSRIQLERDCSIESNCEEPISLETVREVVTEQGYPNSSVQILGSERQGFSIRTSELDVDERTALIDALEAEIGTLDPLATQIDTVGPTIGQQIFRSGLTALLLSFLGITAYLSFRFRLDYALFALVALFHDVVITMGIFSILGLALGREIDSLFIVALLTIVGFSVNDTVVIYDRIRETSKLDPTRHIDDVVDDAVNQTLARSINTTLTTTLTLFAIVLFGGETLKYFALALIVGFILGAYSSIFVASTLLAWWRERHPVQLGNLAEETDEMTVQGDRPPADVNRMDASPGDPSPTNPIMNASIVETNPAESASVESVTESEPDLSSLEDDERRDDASDHDYVIEAEFDYDAPSPDQA